MTRRKESRCLLLYVYSYCLGLGACTIAVIFTWTETSPLSTRVLLAISISLSAGVLVTQTLITRAVAQTRSWALARSAVIVTGLSLSALLTGVAACFYREALGLFFVCCVFSVGLHLVACVAHLVNICRRRGAPPRGGNSADDEDGNGRELDTFPAIMAVSAFVNERLSVNASPMTSPWLYSENLDSRIPDRPCPDVHAARDELHLSLRQLLMLAVPANAVLPTYGDIFDTKPPEYSEVAAGMTSHRSGSPDPCGPQQEGNVSMSAVTEAPPSYEDICSDSIIMNHACSVERNSIPLNQRDDIGSREGHDILHREKIEINPDHENEISPAEMNAAGQFETNAVGPVDINADSSAERIFSYSDERNSIICSEDRNAIIPDERNAITPDERNAIIPDERNARTPVERNAITPVERNAITPVERHARNPVERNINVSK